MIALVLYLGLLVAKVTGALVYLARFPRPKSQCSSVPVTVCQPILSGDPDLESALADSVQALPKANFLWLIDEGDAEASRVTRSLQQRLITAAIEIVSLPDAPDGVNPKLHKLEAARRQLKSGVLVVLDDDTRLPQQSLDMLVQSLETSELSTGLPFYREANNLFGGLLSQFVNNNAALAYLPPLVVSRPVSINGMCYALTTETLERMNGFAPLLRHLTDDLAVADRVRAGGGRIVQTPFPQEVATTIDTARRYVDQMHRWNVFALLLLRRRGLLLNVAITLLYALPPLLLWGGLIELLWRPSLPAMAWLVGVLGGRALALRYVQRRLTGRARHRIVLSVLSELLQPLHLLHALFVRSIRWRTRHYRVLDNDRFVSI
jgi:ceramide glucosyltransferase